MILVSRSAELIEAEVDGDVVGLHVHNGNLYGFNQTATRIWKLIEQPMTLGAICMELAREFRVEPAECKPDVRAMLDVLAADGLVALS